MAAEPAAQSVRDLVNALSVKECESILRKYGEIKAVVTDHFNIRDEDDELLPYDDPFRSYMGMTAEYLAELPAPLLPPGRNGEWWWGHVRCDLVPGLSSQKVWQINGPPSHPAKKAKSDDTLATELVSMLSSENAAQFQSILSQTRDAMFQKAATTSPTKAGKARGYVKLPLMQIAYKAGPHCHDPLAPLPNLGAGASISHLCDNQCIRPEHCTLELAHKANLDRQRCLGSTLILRDDIIIKEVPCPHTPLDDEGEPIWSLSCARVRLIRVDGV